MQKVDLEQFAGGVLSEKFTRAFYQVLHNMQDVNTGSKEKRGITINISFSQNENRDDVKADIAVKTKLAPVLPAKTQFFVGKDLDTGEIAFEEYGNRSTIRGQMSLPLNNSKVVSDEVQEPDEEDITQTSQKSGVVTDFRKAFTK
ncbi:hypothetical protein QA584_17410 [Anaerocolumna sp. AGMB13025]|uniref:hypothetical protein n=1 Tax=Anaerocolumna sp. AGMB13025 TaxID=3039116 RepID=UPI00241CEAB7|nr:hypothetical protein [Anaerocolumna sp. AGMB13025]WFR55379.1 hypothetical protein QA584_17410 [Anaerocolumna sp. AGMB13025]